MRNRIEQPGKIMTHGAIVLWLSIAGLFLAISPVWATGTTAAGSRILKNEFFEAAESYIQSHSPWQENQVTITRKYVNELPVPDQNVRLEVKEFNFSKPWGTLLVPVTVYLNGQTWRRVQVYLDVNMVADVAMAIRNIRYLEAMDSTNVKFVRMALANVPVNSIITPGAMQNVRAKGSVLAGKIITATMVEQTPDVKRGERVTLNVMSHGIMVCALGQAKEDGYIGSKVKVVNISSNKILVGIIRDKGIIEVVN
jgi:flagella basal body P-ring formation protein FlgA